MLTIRQKTMSDYYQIKEWYKDRGQIGFTENFLPPSTYIAEWLGEPVASISLIRTNVKEYAYLENLISNPLFPASERSYVVEQLVKHTEHIAKELGYKKLLCMAPNDKLSDRYQEMGYQPSLKGVTVQVKEL